MATEGPAPVSAQAAGQQRYVLGATKPGRVCVGTNGTFTVNVARQFSSDSPSAPHLFRPGITANMEGVVIEATSQNPAIAEITEPIHITGLTRLPATATVTFRAKQEGVTTILLVAKISAMADFGWSGDLRDQYLSVDVIVTNCRFEVTVYSLWRLDAPDAVVEFRAQVLRAVLEAGEDGEFRQLAPLEWVIEELAAYNEGPIPPLGISSCNYTGSAALSDAGLFATMTEDGELTVDVKYDAVPITFAGECTSSEYAMTPAALHFEVANHGGRGELDQVLTGPAAIPGRAKYVVVPLDGSTQP